jgi:hypothetical protein
MVNFTKIFGLAGAALVFAGLASVQSTCTTSTVAPVIDRGEGTTELIPTITINCTGAGTAGTVALQLFMSLPVTSKIIGSGLSEAQVTGANITAPVQGVVSGNTVSFTGIQTTANGPFTLVVNNLRVNASGAGVTVGGSPVLVTATAFVSGAAATVNPGVISLGTVALLENGLAPAIISQTTDGTTNGKFFNPTVCNSNSKGFLAFYVQVNEAFPTAFKVAAGEASQNAVTGSATNNAVADGTRVQITFANVPANVSVYVPVAPVQSTNPTPAVPANDALTFTNSAPGTPFAAVTGTFPTAAGGAITQNSLAPVTISSGTGTATFEVTMADPNNLGKFNIPVYLVNSAFAVPTGTTTGITATVSLSPVGSTVIPNFSANSATTLTGSSFTLCSTSLLFPFVTNQLGFDTGIAIANTSTDPTGTATPQTGTCTLNFYGSGAPSPNSITTGTIGVATTVGPVYAAAVSGLAAGFQGYVIAQCNFQYAHGFAFVTDGVGAAGGLSQGYLAGVLVNRVTPESLGF